jgi:DNA-binding CsgD family transcriptional regulator
MASTNSIPRAQAANLTDLVEIATRAKSRREFRTAALAWIDRSIGFDTALFGRPEAQGAEAPMILGFEMAFVRQFAERPHRYAPTLGKIVEAAVGGAAPVRDTDIYSLSERDKTPFYTELIGRKGTKIMVVGAMRLAGSLRGTLQISRTARGSRFSDAELGLIREAMPILALGEGVHGPGPSLVTVEAAAERPKLTAREREVLDYVALGLTNAEVALACGTSINTVRSQVASLLRKVGAASRTELVSLALREGILVTAI